MEVAKSASASHWPPDAAAPNIEIGFTSDPQGLLDSVTKTSGQALGDRTSDTRNIKAVTRPVQAWYQTNGLDLARNDDDANSLKVPVLWQNAERNWSPTPFADPGDDDQHRSFNNVLVIVDVRRTTGKSLGLMADYVAMLALSEPRMRDACAPVPSITDLFVGPCTARPAPDGLTAADAAYLTALYEASTSDASVVAARMAKILGSASALAGTSPAPSIRPASAITPPAAPRLPLTRVATVTRAADANPDVAAFVQSYGEAFWNTDNLICVRVEGLPSDQGAAVKARVEADARAVGVSVGRAECGLRYQVEIRFAADADRAVGDVLNYYHHPLWPFPLDRPQGADRPIRAWYGMVYDHAGAPRGQKSLGANPNAGQKFALAIVVVDPARTKGISPDTVSDYVAMLALSQPRKLDQCNVLPSITDLFAGACPGRSTPGELTAADTAYLRTLYTGSAGLRASRTPSDLVDGMAKSLAGGGRTSPRAQAAPAVQPAIAPTAAPRLSLTPISLTTRPATDWTQKTAAFVRSYAAVARGGPQGIPRWRGAVRLQVSGLTAEQNAAVEARIRAVAGAVGAPGQGPPSSLWNTDVAIVFAADPQRVLDQIVAHRPYLLGDKGGVKAITQPVQGWYQIDDQADDKRFGSIVVIVDLRRTRDTKLNLLADYAGDDGIPVSEPRAVDRCQPLPSVMDLFADACPGRAAPGGLTQADDAYLTALYGGASLQTAVYPDEIGARMARILASPTDPTLRTTPDIVIGNSKIRRDGKDMGWVER